MKIAVKKLGVIFDLVFVNVCHLQWQTSFVDRQNHPSSRVHYSQNNESNTCYRDRSIFTTGYSNKLSLCYS